MYKRTLRYLALSTAFILFATAGARADSVSVVTSLGGLSANDTIVWSTIGADAFPLPASQGFTSTHGLNGTAVLSGPNSLIAVVCPETLCSWNPAGTTGFSAGDSLIWTADTGVSGNGPLTVNFTSKNVAAAGAFIQYDGPGQFTAQVQPFNGVTPLGVGPFTVTSDAGGDAVFIGVLDNTGPNISSVVFSITSCTGDCTDFAIDTVSLNAPAGGTPTPTATSTGATATATPTATSTGATATPTATPTATATATATATQTATRTATPTATATAVPGTLKIKPNHKNYGKIKVGGAKIFTFTLSNSARSGPAITLTSVAVPATNPQEFGFPPPPFTTCTQQLLPKQKCKLKVEFVPASPGFKSSTLTIFDNATGNPQMVPLSGTGK